MDSLPPKKPFLRLFLFVGENGLYWLNCPILTPQCYILLESCASDLSENLVESQILSFYKLPEFPTEGQYSGKMLAEMGSFDILFWNWVLGIGFFLHIHISIHIYTYIFSIGYWLLGFFIHT